MLAFEELKDFECLNSERKKNEFLASRFLVKNLLSEFTSIPSLIKKRDNNSPYFMDERLKDKLSLSYSHSRNYCSVVISDRGKVGIDVEEINRFRGHKAHKKWLTPKEINHIEDSAQDDKSLCVLWTKKEALCKASGLGYGFEFKKHEVLNKKKYHIDGVHYHLKTTAKSDYICTVCSTDLNDTDCGIELFIT